jgi:hypothetical protein
VLETPSLIRCADKQASTRARCAPASLRVAGKGIAQAAAAGVVAADYRIIATSARSSNGQEKPATRPLPDCR